MGNQLSSVNSLVVHSVPLEVHLRRFLRAFALAYGVRTSFSVVLHIVELVKHRQYASLLSMKKLFAEDEVVVRVSAIRLACFFAFFSGGLSLFRSLLHSVTLRESSSHVAVAGFLSGLAIFFQERDDRKTWALYLAVRAAQCVWTHYKKTTRRSASSALGLLMDYGDVLLFCLSCAQLLYAFVMRPDTLPPSYYSFLKNTGSLSSTVLKAVKDSNEKIPIDVEAFNSFCSKRSGKEMKPICSAHPDIIPCSALHPSSSSCLKHIILLTLKTAVKVLPLYGSLSVISLVLLKGGKLASNPFQTISSSLLGVIRSVAFISSFVGLQQTLFCLHRKFFKEDSGKTYFIFGLISSFCSIWLEDKGKREELALYVLPRALDSFLTILLSPKPPSTSTSSSLEASQTATNSSTTTSTTTSSVSPPKETSTNKPAASSSLFKYSDSLLFCCATSILSYFHEYEKQSISPVILKTWDFFLRT